MTFDAQLRALIAEVVREELARAAQPSPAALGHPPAPGPR